VKEQKGKRSLSRDARRRMGEAGFKNLASWRAQASTRTQELGQEVDAFRAGLLRDVGANPTATKLGLIEATTTTYAAILKVRHAVIHSRKRDVESLTAVLSAATGNIARLLRLLDLDRKSRPRSLAEVFARKGAATPSNSGQNAPDTKESAPKRGDPA
jgi:hypothetical protein